MAIYGFYKQFKFLHLLNFCVCEIQYNMNDLNEMPFRMAWISLGQNIRIPWIRILRSEFLFFNWCGFDRSQQHLTLFYPVLQCSVRCGEGFQEREVECKTSNGERRWVQDLNRGECKPLKEVSARPSVVREGRSKCKLLSPFCKYRC